MPDGQQSINITQADIQRAARERERERQQEQEAITEGFEQQGALGGGGGGSDTGGGGGGTDGFEELAGAASRMVDDLASGATEFVDQQAGGADEAVAQAVDTAERAVGNVTTERDTASGTDGSGGGSAPPQSQQQNLGRVVEQTPDAQPQPTERQEQRLQRLGDQTPEPATDSARERGRQQAREAQAAFLSGEVGQDAGDIEQGVSETVGRGSPASEAARDVAATGLDIGFQEPQEFVDAAEGATGVDTGLDVSERTGGIAVSGPGVVADVSEGQLFQSGERGDINRQVVGSLSGGRGLFAEEGDASGFFTETEESLRETAEQRQEFFGVGEEAERLTPNVDVLGADVEEFTGGLGAVPGQAAAAPSNLLLGADTAAEVAGNAPETVGEFGAAETAETALNVGGATAGGVVEQIEQNPERFAGEVAGGLAGGFAAGRAIQGAPDVARNVGIRARGGDIFDADDLADPPTRTEGLELPGFTREAQADPEVARREFVEQAEANPLAGDAPTAFSVRGADAMSEFGRFGRRFEAPEGRSEIPGLFQSADLSNLRLPGTEGSGISVGLPSPNLGGARALAERDVDVGVAEGRTTAEVGEFISEQADRGQSFIRGGDVTPEQEAVAPPGAEFVDDGGTRKSFDPSWEQSDSGERLGYDSLRDGGGWIYRKASRRVDALQVVAAEERIIRDVTDYPDGENFWRAVQALRERGAAIPYYEGDDGTHPDYLRLFEESDDTDDELRKALLAARASKRG